MLQPLCEQILRISQQQAATPVLVTPREFTLQTPFFVALATTLAEKTDREIQLDWYRDGIGLWHIAGDALARRQAKGLQRALPPGCSVQVTATIARPADSQRPLVIGLCQESQTLPSWTVPIRFSAQAA